jgi:hypothetical protein
MMNYLRALLIRTFVLLFAVVSSITPAASTNIEISGFEFASAAPVQASITFLQCANSTANASSYTFNTQNTGTASADRVTLVGVVAEDSATDFSTNSVTVGGDSATELIKFYSSNLETAAFYALSNTADTSETVVVTPSEAITGLSICLWQVNNIAFGGTHGFYSIHSFTFDSSLSSTDIIVPARGVGAAISVTSAATQSVTYTGMTEVADLQNGEFDYGAADYTEDDTASVPLAVSFDWTGTVLSAGLYVAFHPSDFDETAEYVTPLQCYDNPANATTYTFTSANVGPVGSGNRTTIVAISAADLTSVFNVTGVTIGGTSATEVVDQAGGSSAGTAAIYIDENPTGTAEDIVVTMSEAIVGMYICVFAVYGIDSETANDTATGTNTTGASVSLNLDTQADGFVIAACGTVQSAVNYTWVGVANVHERGDFNAESSGGAAAFIETTSVQTPRTVSADSAIDASHIGCVAASW